jgi:NADPH2:quinone reductase
MKKTKKTKSAPVKIVKPDIFMPAIEIRDGKLHSCTRPLPPKKAGEILIKVEAAGINRPDILQRKGLYPPPEGVTDIPGLEIAGTVVTGGKTFRKGQKVCALVAGGGYAGYCSVPEGQCLPVPKDMDFLKAAALPETFFTVWTNLFDRGLLKKGERILIHGGSSGIGTAAIQIARAFGATVYVTAGTDAKCKACIKLGAKGAVNYRNADFVADIMKETQDKGVDMVLDMVGGDYIRRNLQVLAPFGRHVSIAMQKGRIAEIDLFHVMSKKLILTGSTLRPQSAADKAKIAKALQKKVWPLLSRKKIAPVIDKVFPLKDAQLAHDYLEAGNHVGKVMLTFN